MGKICYFYYNDKGEKRGGFSGREIKALAKSGLIKPETVIETEDGKQYKAIGIGGVEFGSEERKESTPSEFESSIIVLSADNPFIDKTEPIPVSVPVLTPPVAQESTPPQSGRNEPIDRIMVLCIVSFFVPGLGHYGLGCGAMRSAWVFAKALWTLFVFCFLLVAIAGLCIGGLGIVFGGDFFGAYQIVMICLTIFSPLLIGFVLFVIHDSVIQDLKVQYKKMKTSVTHN